MNDLHESMRRAQEPIRVYQLEAAGPLWPHNYEDRMPSTDALKKNQYTITLKKKQYTITVLNNNKSATTKRVHFRTGFHHGSHPPTKLYDVQSCEPQMLGKDGTRAGAGPHTMKKT